MHGGGKARLSDGVEPSIPVCIDNILKGLLFSRPFSIRHFFKFKFMKKKLSCYTRKVYADQITPISAYLNIRGLFAGSFLLESSEIDDKQNARSIICANPIAGIELKADTLKTYFRQESFEKPVEEISSIQHEMNQFFSSFEVENSYEGLNGFFGFQSFEAVRFFETKKANLCPVIDESIPVLDYRLFQYVIVFNHFNNEIVFVENAESNKPSTLESLADEVLTKRSATYPFSMKNEESAFDTEPEFIEKVKTAQHHCKRGDVFQMVLSRKFKVGYHGDEFNVYRALRHINPSPYLFYFDYGSFKIFGSSPEAQIRISNNEALINPIAGTFRRTGDKEKDKQLGEKLLEDKKETAEHSMLVDLARNDLNRHCTKVEVSEYKSIKFFSHVIHMVSTVKGKLNPNANGIDVLADTFPAGTLSGAPKVRAIQLLSELENDPRSFYGGSIGFIDFNGEINQAIIIRSFLAKNNEIFYRAGAGVVLKSVPENELQEVNNKLAALRNALVLAQNF